MAWVSTTYVDNLVGRTVIRQQLFAVDGTYASTAFDQAELAARSTIISYMLHAGYESPSDSLTSGSVTEGWLADKCAALMVSRAFARAKGIQWPPGLQDSVKASLAELELMYEKKLPIPGLSQDTVAGYGGVNVSDTTGDEGRPQVFDRISLKTW